VNTAAAIARVDHRANNFDFLRFVAASLVLYSHCFALTGMGGAEPLVRLTMGEYAFGGLAVRVFFVISGYLVMQSWLRRPRIIVFAGARCLRIFPGLALALAYSVAVGAIATTLSFSEYWSHTQTHEYFWHNLTLQTEFFLPGVFEHNLAPRAVNGSLWSLYYELRAYVVVLALGVAGLFFRRWIGAVAWIAAASLIVMWPQAWGIVVADDWPVINVFACFIVAALVALVPQLQRSLGWIALVSVIAVPLAFRFGGRDVAIDALLVSGTLWFARRRLPGVAAFGRFGDFSYGVFLFAFPTQQLIAWLTATHEPYLMLAIAFPATVALAALSWHLVERPCLALKRHLEMPRLQAFRAAALPPAFAWLRRKSVRDDAAASAPEASNRAIDSGISSPSRG